MINYDITVIVPIYNCSKYISNTIKSLIKQNYDFRKIEVLLIDDGSTDDSLNVCENFASKYNNIKVFHHENHGVSYTRNVGLKKANGAYIMFLDADDYLSENAIFLLVNFFDKNYDLCDLVTYSLYYIKNGKNVSAPKNDDYNKTGIYDLNSDKLYNISTINFVIKNRKKGNLLFNENLIVHEDMDYSMRLALPKGKVGYVKEASYYYVKRDDSTVAKYMNPYYIFEAWINLFEEAFKTYLDSNGKPVKYLQYLFLNEINWKLKEKMLYPMHYSDKELDRAIKRVKALVNLIDDNIILNDKKVDKFHKYYFLSMKDNKFEVRTNNDIELLSNNKVIAKEKDIEIVLTCFKVLKDKLYISGYFKSYLFNFIDPCFYVLVDGNLNKLDVKESTNSYYKTCYKTNNFYHFDLEVDVNNNYLIQFKVQMNDKLYPVKYYLMPNIVLNKKLERMSFLYKYNLIGIDNNNDIVIKKITEEKRKEVLKKTKKVYDKINKQIYYIRKASGKMKDEIWLYNDKENVIDNAYYQFKHDIKKNDGIKRYYVVSNDASFYKDKFTKKELKYVIKFRSIKHFILYLNASKILTSFRNVEFYSPFYKHMSYYADIVKYELIYLQHGVLHCHTPELYSKECNNIDKIVISSDFEYNNFIDNYNYTHKDLIKCGMPRLDIYKVQKPKEKILLALSWRVNLMGPYKEKGYEKNPSKFLNSTYYKELISFLNDPKLEALLQKNDLTLEILSHPIFKVYDEYIKFKSNRIKLIDKADDCQYKLMITDYSSIVFDYVYTMTPILYFVPDYDLYKAGITHLYSKLDLKLEDGFGPLTTSVDELIRQIDRFIKNGDKFDTKYINKGKNFFISKGNHMEKLYNELMEK